MLDAEPSKPSTPAPAFHDRRTFLGVTAGAAAMLAVPPLVRPARARGETARGIARNIIFVVVDGMSSGTLQLGDLFIRRKRGEMSNWIRLAKDERTRRGIVETSAHDSLVTDSAAAATAWGTGELVNNGAIGMTPDGRMPTPILVHARDAGKATGLVTTTRLTHATPAGFIANIPARRDREDMIAPQYLDRGVDVLLGGGGAYLTPSMLSEVRDATVCATRNEMLEAVKGPDLATKRLIGVFNNQHMNYMLDRPTSEPTLAEMTTAALAKLSLAPGGFVVQIEGGRVDHAAHENDAAALLHDMAAFDEALGITMRYCEDHPDTLLLVTTDHACGNPGLTDYGKSGNQGFERLIEAKHSYVWIAEQLNRRMKQGGESPGDVLRGVFAEGMGVQLADDEIAMIERRLGGEVVDPFRMANGQSALFGSLLANHFAVGFLSVNHCSDLVDAMAFGPGSERLGRFARIHELHRVMVEGLDLPPARPI